MLNGSWNDAERLCRQEDGHLWSINSYSEWWHIYNLLSLPGLLTDRLPVFEQARQLQQSILFFIGIQFASNQVIIIYIIYICVASLQKGSHVAKIEP